MPQEGGPSANSRHTNVGAIVGPVIAGVALLAVVLAFWLHRRGVRRRELADAAPSPYGEPAPSVPQLSKSAREKMAMERSLSSSGDDAPHGGAALPYGPRTASDQALVGRDTGADSEPHAARGADAPTSATRSFEARADTSAPLNQRESGRQARLASGQSAVDVDRIIELLAQRIDGSALRLDPEGPPPRYPE